MSEDELFQRMRSAMVIDSLGGKTAYNSGLFQAGIMGLVDKGMKIDEILTEYERRWPEC